MSLNCGREKDVAAMLEAGHWPAACGDELREHVAGCARCGDLVLVASTMQRVEASLGGFSFLSGNVSLIVAGLVVLGLLGGVAAWLAMDRE